MQDCLCENHSQSLWGESLVEVIKGKSCVFDMLYRKKTQQGVIQSTDLRI